MNIALLLFASVVGGAPCDDAVPIYRDGRMTGVVCAASAAAGGLTVIDLSASWTPAALDAAPGETAPTYRAVYQALSAGRWSDAGADGVIGEQDAFLEVYGVMPSLDVIAARLADDASHRCHDAIDDTPLLATSETAREEPTADARARIRHAAELRSALERQRQRRALEDLDALARTSDYYARQVARLRAAERYLAGVRAAQAHLACDGLLATRYVDGAFTWRTAIALAAFQRRTLLAPDGHLGEDTRAMLAEDARELDLRAALRALRERVVAATGLIEDGSASGGHAPVLGRLLDPERNAKSRGHAPLEEGAPDLIAAATDAAARALGWTDANRVESFLAAPPERVAIALPALPAYHAAHMDLSVEIDRGDVWYDTRPTSRKVERRPALTLWARDGGRRIALVRWPTTIGGWNDEKLGSGEVVGKWKESPAGEVVWRDLYIAPTWLPPDTTPDRELVRPSGGKHVLAAEAIGPSYRSAYGLSMLVHHVPVLRKRGIVFDDRGIRTHGSSKIAAIFDGRSHGCHRLLPLYALRLGGFLLAHRNHVRRGEMETWFRRDVHYRGDFRIEVRTRGHLVELTPPVPVEVLTGTIRSKRTTPPTRSTRALRR